MNKTKKILIAIMSLILMFSSIMFIVGCGNSEKPEGNTDQDQTETTPEGDKDPEGIKSGLNDTLYYISMSINDREEYILVSSLNGLLTQKGKSAIYIQSDLPDGEDIRTNITSQTGKEFTKVDDVWELIDIFKADIKDSGYILYNVDNKSVNPATTVAGVEGYVLVDEKLEEDAIAYGLTKKIDMSARQAEADENLDNLDYIIFEEYKDRLNNKLLVHQQPEKAMLRDWAIANKAFTFFVGDNDSEDYKMFRWDVYDWAEPNAPVFGFCNDALDSKYEFISDMNKYSKYNITSDFVENLALLNALKLADETEIKQSKYEKADVTAQAGKHYVTLVMTEGNNMTWQSNGFVNNELYFDYEYKTAVPVTFGISPAFAEYAPSLMRNIYDKASPKQYFMTGLSGAGYADMTNYNVDQLAQYAKTTNDMMKKADLKYVNLLSSDLADGIEPTFIEEFAKQENIDGGILSTPNNYADADGSIYWSNEKPFVAARELLWRENPKRVAYRINNYVKDYTKIEGYTVVEFYPFDINAKALKKFIDQLDETVEIVNMDEFITLIKNNVAKTDKVDLDDKDKRNDAEFDNYPGIINDYIELEDLVNDERTVPTEKLEFHFDTEDEFKEFGCGNGDKQFDFANYNPTNGNIKKGSVTFSGNDSGLKDTQGNSWIYRKIKLPKENNLNMSVAYMVYVKGSDMDARIRVTYKDESGNIKVDILKDWTTYKTNPQWTIEKLDISKYSGKTVTFIFEANDNGNSYNEFLVLDDIIISSYDGSKEVYPLLTNGDVGTTESDAGKSWTGAELKKWKYKSGNGGTATIDDTKITLNAPADADTTNTYSYAYNKVKVTKDVLRVVKNEGSRISIDLLLVNNNNVIKHIVQGGKTVLTETDITVNVNNFINQELIIILKLEPEGKNNSAEITTVEFTDPTMIKGIENLSKEEVKDMECQTKQDFTDEDHSYWISKNIKGTRIAMGHDIMFEGTHGVSKPDGVVNQYVAVKVKIASDSTKMEILGRGHDFNSDGKQLTNGNWRVRFISTDNYEITTVKEWFDVQCSADNKYNTYTTSVPEALRGKEVVIVIETDSGLVAPSNFAYDFSWLGGFKLSK